MNETRGKSRRRACLCGGFTLWSVSDTVGSIPKGKEKAEVSGTKEELQYLKQEALKLQASKGNLNCPLRICEGAREGQDSDEEVDE